MNTFFAACLLLFLVEASSGATYIPSGCSTLTSCEQRKNEKGELNGPQKCVNAYKKEIIVIKANWKNDKLEGDFFCAKDEGEPFIQAYYKNGEFDGLYKEYDSSLKAWGLEQHYSAGKREGIAKRMLSGDRLRITNYKNDQAHGFTIILDKDKKILNLLDCEVENKRLKSEDCEKIDVPGYEKIVQDYLAQKNKKKHEEDNREVIVKNKNQEIKESYKIVDGKREGKYETFYDNGKIQSQAQYEKGQRISEKIFFKEGQLQSESLFKGTWTYKHTEYFQNGKKKSEETQEISSSDKWLTDIEYANYFDNGQISEKGRRIQGAGSWSSGAFDGEIDNYAKDGKLTWQRFYKRGKSIGTWKASPEHLDYDTEEIYADGILMQRTETDRKTKKLMRKLEYFPDGSTKTEFVDPTFKDRF